MNQKAGNFASTIKGDLTMSEGFYSSYDWETRGPKQIKNEFEQIQKEAFIQQQKILQFVTDARTLGIPDYKIADSLKRLKNDKLVGAIMYMKTFTPYTYYGSAFNKRYETALRDSQLNGTPPPEFNYVYPIKELVEVNINHMGLDLTKSYEENMKIKAERKASFKNKKDQKLQIEEPKIDSNENILNLLNAEERAKLDTPPLPIQPAVRVASNTNASPAFASLPKNEQYKLIFPNG